MPIYEYRCASCQQVFARLQPVGATGDRVSCPGCGSEDVSRMVSAFASSSTSGPGAATGPGPGCGGGGGFT